MEKVVKMVGMKVVVDMEVGRGVVEKVEEMVGGKVVVVKEVGMEMV